MSDDEAKPEVFTEPPTASGIANEVLPAPVETEPAPVDETPAPEAKPKKERKKRRPLTDEEKERLKQNLARGRATSLAKRRKKAQLKKIELEEKNAAEDERIFQAYKKKRKPAELMEENDTLKKQIAELKMQMEAAKKQEIIAPIKEKIKREKKEKTAAIEDSDDEAPKQKLIQVLETPKLIPKPEKKKMSGREIMRLMKGL